VRQLTLVEAGRVEWQEAPDAGLAGRAPYFHNGSAATLEDVIGFYDKRFGLGLSNQQRADLVAFLRAL
jgi:cytochrome c peroxidase